MDLVLRMGPHGLRSTTPVKRGELLNVVAHCNDCLDPKDPGPANATVRWRGSQQLDESLQQLIRAIRALVNGHSTIASRCNDGCWTSDFLLGDSAHAMLPYLGQGAPRWRSRTGACLQPACSSQRAARKPRTRRTVLASAAAKRNHLASPWAAPHARHQRSHSGTGLQRQGGLPGGVAVFLRRRGRGRKKDQRQPEVVSPPAAQ